MVTAKRRNAATAPTRMGAAPSEANSQSILGKSRGSRKKAPSSASGARHFTNRRGTGEQLLSKLEVQQSLLNQLKTCNEILHFNAEDRSTQEWKHRLSFLLSTISHVDFDDIVEELLLDNVLRTPIDFDLPTDADQQLLVGMVFAEASGPFADEIEAIVSCMVNCANYASYKEPGKKCYNDSFGDGTILSAIKKCSRAYGSGQWTRVMVGDLLKAKTDLEGSLIPSEVSKLKACCEGVATVSAGSVPYSDPASKRCLIQFNQAADSPPSNRQEKVAKYGAHTFYAFKKGRECQ